jgi:hypothetical protein
MRIAMPEAVTPARLNTMAKISNADRNDGILARHREAHLEP